MIVSSPLNRAKSVLQVGWLVAWCKTKLPNAGSIKLDYYPATSRQNRAPLQLASDPL